MSKMIGSIALILSIFMFLFALQDNSEEAKIAFISVPLFLIAAAICFK